MLFINDLPTAISKCNILSCADDTVIFAAHKDIKIVEDTLNGELNEVYNWPFCNFLFINKRETKFIIFGIDANGELENRELSLSGNNRSVTQSFA